MALNFPDSPSLNQVYTDTTSGFSYQWDGVVWKSFAPASSSQIRIIDDISGSFNGSTQTFALTSTGTAIIPGNAQQLRVVLGGIVQEPLTDYTVSGSNITFTTAPGALLDCSIVSLGPAVPVNTIEDGTVTPPKLSTGGPTWNTSGDVYISGIASVGTAITMYASSGIVSATAFYGDGANLSNTGSTLSAASGTERLVFTNLTTGTMTASSTDANVTYNATTQTLSAPNVSIAGTLTYEDVTNVDSIGIITARSGIVLGPTANTIQLGTGTTISSPASDTFTILTGGNNRIEIQADGDIDIDGGGVFYDATNNRLSIGTTSPAGPLHVQGTSDQIRGGDGTTTSFLGGSGGNGYTGTLSNHRFDFYTNSQLRATIDTSGRLLVGTSSARTADGGLSTPVIQHQGTSPSFMAIRAESDAAPGHIILAKSRGSANEVVSNGDSIGLLSFQAADGTNLIRCAEIRAQVDGTPGTNDMPGRIVLSTTSDGASSPTERARISSTGGFSVGTTADPGAGAIYATGDITAFYSSDIRLKKDIEPISEPIKKLMEISGVTYKWNEEYLKDKEVDGYFVRETEIGVIAQEVEKVLPEVVATRENGYKAVRYEKLVALLIEAVKDQQKQIDELRAQVEGK